jgi:probable rRNA maturation factor
VLELDVLGDSPLQAHELLELCTRTTAAAGVQDGHLAIEFVDAPRIAQLNKRFRGRARPTDVLSFPVDGAEPILAARAPDGTSAPALGARELGDVVICPEHTADVREAVVHGVLHLLGMDHETDDGEMLALQRELLAAARG